MRDYNETMGSPYMLGALSPANQAAMTRNVSQQTITLPQQPNWRGNQVAPGMWGPREGLEILPMNSMAGGSIVTFDANNSQGGFQARPQRPFRCERLLVSVGRQGTSAIGPLVLAQGIYVGTKLQQLQLGEFDLEVFTSNAFGVRMALDCADPGIEVTIALRLAGTLTGTDKILVGAQWLGSSLM